MGMLILGLSGGLLLAATATDSPAQVTGGKLPPGIKLPAPKSADILTADKVELKVQYYPSLRPRSPCVLLLHALGDNSNNKEWTNFAKKLQERGYFVAMFDFRGHGDSTGVQPGSPSKKGELGIRGFWDEIPNQQGAGGFSATKARPTEIKSTKFTAAYLPVLVNDIAAVKTFLDDQDCDTNNLILIGVKDGATLGALWLNSEFHRFRWLPPGPGTPQGAPDKQNPEGLAVTAAVWISATSTLGKTNVNLTQLLDVPAKGYKVPMLFIYGQGDEKGRKVAKDLEKALAPGGSKKDAPLFTGAKEIAGAEKATGRELLLESRPTTEVILEYLDSLPARKLASTAAKRTGDESYVWEYVTKTGQPNRTIARKAGSKMLEFNAYNSFLK